MKAIVIFSFDLVLKRSHVDMYYVKDEELQDRLDWARKNFDKDAQRGWISPFYEVKVVDSFRITSF